MKKKTWRVTWISVDDSCSAAEVASNVGIAILLIVVIEGIGGMGNNIIGFEAGAALADRGTICVT